MLDHSYLLSESCGSDVLRDVEMTRQYIDAAQFVFYDLREVARQLATLALFAEFRLTPCTGDHPLMFMAEQRFSVAREQSGSLRPSFLGAHHHRHLVLAIERFGDAITLLRKMRPSVGHCGAALSMLRSAWQEMMQTSRALPGFDTIDVSQSCCGCMDLHRINPA